MGGVGYGWAWPGRLDLQVLEGLELGSCGVPGGQDGVQEGGSQPAGVQRGVAHHAGPEPRAVWNQL